MKQENQSDNLQNWGIYGWNYKTECYLLKHEFQKYAQYDKAVYIEFIPKGKEKQDIF